MAASFAPGDPSTTSGLGFDATVSPPWVMVPDDPVRAKTVLLTGGAGLTIRLANSARAGVVSFAEGATTPNGRPVVLTGKMPGTVRLEAQNASGVAEATLEITVKAQRKLPTFIHFVFDKSGRCSVRGLSDAEHMIDVANKILLPQANVMMFRKDSGAVKVPFDLDKGIPIPAAFNVPAGFNQSQADWPCFSKDPIGPQGCMPPTTQGSMSKKDFEGIKINNILANILNHADPKPSFNIFMLRRFDDPVTIAPTQAFCPRNLKGNAMNCCLMPDISSGQILAHELCHFLLDGATFLSRTLHSTGRNDLLVEVPGPLNLQIPKNQANFMNPSGFP